ncbi:hypothetical protein NEDG_01462 [Nematocida displodere]|uniref:Chromatin assembly factor 1 subunit A dimerization domain-containing protein n=1 Tax=Nematocida displodere TaxID=1805483 RepID=A0A177ED91_9MICR|nr:hypothetical protein NEDG_01462 [Nematocida displodere]
MYNSRFSTSALKMLIDFKRGKEVFPPEELMLSFVDLLSVPPRASISEHLAKESFEYFYAGKKDVPPYTRFLEWTSRWTKRAGVHHVHIEVSNQKEGICSGFSILAVESKLIAERTRACQARRGFVRSVQVAFRTILQTVGRLKVKLSEDLLHYIAPALELCPEAKAPPKPQTSQTSQTPQTSQMSQKPPKPQTSSSLLAFATKKEATEARAEAKVKIALPGRLYPKKTTTRMVPEVAAPIRMVFFKHHGEIRPPYYNAKHPGKRLQARNSLKKILQEEDYAYNSEEEWVEGDGESINEDSLESDDEEGEDEGWIEPDTNEVLFTKGQLPRLDHPFCREYALDETVAE